MPEMTEAMGREIIDVAIKAGAWEEPGETAHSLPADRVMKEAAALVQTARMVYDKQPDPMPQAVSDILFAAQVEPVDGKFNDIYENRGAQPPSVSASPPGTPAEQQIPGSGDAFQQQGGAGQTEIGIDAIYPGYDDQKAKDIVEAVKASAASGDLTPEEWAQIKAYEEAHEERKSIISLEPEFKAPEPEPAPTVSTGSPTGTGFVQEPGDYASGDELRQAYEGGSLGTDRVSQEGLPVPSAPSGDQPTLPVDITQVSDQDLSRLIMTFHSLEARTLWILSQEEGRREACMHLRHDSHRAAFSSAFERIKSGIEKQTGTALEAARSEANKEADSDASVVAWRNRETRHGIEARSLKALSDGYGNAAARLSRELTRRTELRQTPTGG